MPIAETIWHVLRAYGYPVFFLLILIEECGIPLLFVPPRVDLPLKTREEFETALLLPVKGTLEAARNPRKHSLAGEGRRL